MANVIPVKAKYDVGGNAVALAELEAGDKIPAEYLGGSPTLEDAIFDSIQLTGGTGEQGTFSWNADEETVDLVQDGTVLQLGQELQVHCRNNSASAMTSGMAVMAVGTLGASGRILVAPMNASVPANAKMFIGIVTEAIAAGTDGKVTVFGKVRGFNTSAWAGGSVLWCDQSTPGALTTVKPATGVALPVAFVVHSHATQGTLMVRTTNTSENIAISDIIGLTSALAGKVDTTDPRLSDARPASDVSAWAKAATKPTYSKAEVGLSDVDNTSDVNKPVSTAQQAALDAKADKTITITAGNGLSGGGDLSGNRTLAVNYGTTAGTAAQGNDARLSDAREWTAETVAQVEAEEGTGTARRAWTAQRVRQAIAAWWNSITNIDGKAIGQTTSAAGSFTTLRATDLLSVGTAGIQSSGTSDLVLESRPTGAGVAFIQGANTVIRAGSSGSYATYGTFSPAGLSVTGGLTATDNVGIGVTPSAWGGPFKVLTVGSVASSGSLSGTTTVGELYLGANSYHDGSSWRYVTSGTSQLYRQNAGQHEWFTTPPGTAGNAISFTQAMILDMHGNLSNIGGYSNEQFQTFTIAANTNYSPISVAGDKNIQSIGGVGAPLLLNSHNAASVRLSSTGVQFSVSYLERARIDNAGNLGLGTVPSEWVAAKALQLNDRSSLFGFANDTHIAYNCYYSETGYRYIASDFASDYQQTSGQHRWFSAPAGNAGDPIGFTQAMVLDAAGVLAIASLPANDFPNDAAAAADGIPIGGLYHTSGTVKVRLT